MISSPSGFFSWLSDPSAASLGCETFSPIAARRALLRVSSFLMAASWRGSEQHGASKTGSSRGAQRKPGMLADERARIDGRADRAGDLARHGRDRFARIVSFMGEEVGLTQFRVVGGINFQCWMHGLRLVWWLLAAAGGVDVDGFRAFVDVVAELLCAGRVLVVHICLPLLISTSW